ncbi:hypothetical protein EUGRSUZ_B01201 [Eucalyptus grandis]|uniref:Cytochrome P450 n=2 Tax=Eucalyptus grandis TaxID=71139 RepID=A0A059D2B7_EUCGR|nr:hypothetical protein EUGRSUZ_B01201 [Eucalyptus grandis]
MLGRWRKNCIRRGKWGRFREENRRWWIIQGKLASLPSVAGFNPSTAGGLPVGFEMRTTINGRYELCMSRESFRELGIEMFFAGSKTTSSTIEWAMAELLRQPESMKKAKDEIARETRFMGFDIPKDTQVLVNAWGIGRDPDAKEDALAFKPERFLGSNTDFKGQNIELIPFRSGRRMCVGLSLAHRVLHLGLATLLYHFN